MSKRLAGRCGYPADDPFAVTLHEDRLEQPERWRKARHVFVCSMGDLYHARVPSEFVQEVFAVMRRTPQHTYMVLTKRPARMLRLLRLRPVPGNVWLGVSVEDQQTAAERIPLLLTARARVRFVSAEPLLGMVSLSRWLRRIQWVIAGCESGPRARPAPAYWFQLLRDQCKGAGVPFFLKQMREGGELIKMPRLDGRVYDERP
jgi:protein gp37